MSVEIRSNSDFLDFVVYVVNANRRHGNNRTQFYNSIWFDLILFIVLNTTFSNISAISWQSVLVVEDAGENHRPWGSNSKVW